MSTVTKVSTKMSASSEKIGIQDCEISIKKLDEAIKRNAQLNTQTAELINGIAKRNHEACEKAKLEEQKQAKERAERKAAKETRLSEIEAKIGVMFYGFENIKKASDESINKVDFIVERMDTVLNEVTMMRDEFEAKDVEIISLHSKINRQDKEIEMLKTMIAEQKRMLEIYMQFNAK